MARDPLEKYIPKDIRSLYEIQNVHSAAQVLATSCRAEFKELMEALRGFRLTLDDIRKPGGNKSDIPKRISKLLEHKGWLETRIKGDLIITKVTGTANTGAESREDNESESETLDVIKELKQSGHGVEQIKRENFLDGHKVDHVKNRVAFDMEWNSKDQTFDRDLYAFRAFHECDLIDAAVILTRGSSLNSVFDRLGAERNQDGTVKRDKKGNPKLLKSKYGASTTWMGKLIYRLNAGRHGGCPVLALGITPQLVTDWREFEKKNRA